jgi:hypothetical protein
MTALAFWVKGVADGDAPQDEGGVTWRPKVS